MHDAVVEHVGAGERERQVGQTVEQPGTVAEDHRIDQQVQLVDQLVAQQRPHQLHEILHAQRQHAWIDAQVSWPLVWQEECGLLDREVLVDETQLAALRTELGAVLDRYRRRGAGTPGARRVTAVVALTPLPRRT